MAFNGSGTFVRAHNWVTDKTNVVPVTASRMDTECDGFATGLDLPHQGRPDDGDGPDFVYAWRQSPWTDRYRRPPMPMFPTSIPGCISRRRTNGAYCRRRRHTHQHGDGAYCYCRPKTYGESLPTTDAGASLGTTALQWTNLFLMAGGAIKFNASGVTVTESSDALSFAGASSGYTDLMEVVAATAPMTLRHLVLPALPGQICFWPQAQSINFNAGDVTITHSANLITISGGTTAAGDITSSGAISGATAAGCHGCLPGRAGNRHRDRQTRNVWPPTLPPWDGKGVGKLCGCHGNAFSQLQCDVGCPRQRRGLHRHHRQ